MKGSRLDNKIILVVGGADTPGSGIVAILLAQGATVIVPVPNATGIYSLRESIGKEYQDRLITYPTDFGEYERGEELVEIIVSEYGHLDLVVAAVEKVAGHSELLSTDIRDWHKMMDANITASFVIDRLCLPLLGKNGGMLINISNADHLLPDTDSSLTRLSGIAAIELSKAFAAEARQHQLRYCHLLINNLAPANEEQEITPAMIGEKVIDLYQDNSGKMPETFHFLTGKPLDANILNRLKG